jgi:hypothetical protein
MEWKDLSWLESRYSDGISCVKEQAHKFDEVKNGAEWKKGRAKDDLYGILN